MKTKTKNKNNNNNNYSEDPKRGIQTKTQTVWYITQATSQNTTIFSKCQQYDNIMVFFEVVTGDPCNLIGSQQCDLFTNHTIFALNHICPKSR